MNKQAVAARARNPVGCQDQTLGSTEATLFFDSNMVV